MLYRFLVTIVFTVVVCHFFDRHTQAIVDVTIINVKGSKPVSPSQTVVIKGGSLLGYQSRLEDAKNTEKKRFYLGKNEKVGIRSK